MSSSVIEEKAKWLGLSDQILGFYQRPEIAVFKKKKITFNLIETKFF